MNFIKAGSACPITKVADVDFNLNEIKKCVEKAIEEQVKILVFPELSITSYSCADLFFQQKLLKKAEVAIENLCVFSEGRDILFAVGAPFEYDDVLYNAAYLIFNGKVLGIVPKSYLPNASEFYEKRWFSSGLNITSRIV
ncbi:MAG TPA: NAD(+) synthase, partial [Clostridium sp.]|nr:NAD(+) synthase [Clostridium sp.]